MFSEYPSTVRDHVGHSKCVISAHFYIHDGRRYHSGKSIRYLVLEAWKEHKFWYRRSSEKIKKSYWSVKPSSLLIMESLEIIPHRDFLKDRLQSAILAIRL